MNLESTPKPRLIPVSRIPHIPRPSPHLRLVNLVQLLEVERRRRVHLHGGIYFNKINCIIAIIIIIITILHYHSFTSIVHIEELL